MVKREKKPQLCEICQKDIEMFSRIDFSQLFAEEGGRGFEKLIPYVIVGIQVLTIILLLR